MRNFEKDNQKPISWADENTENDRGIARRYVD